MSRKVCNFFNTSRGCNRGSECRFLHAALGDSSSSPSVPQPSASPAPSPKAPPGICRFFWVTGRCARGFDCHYRHIEEASRINANPRDLVIQTLAPFLTEAGLAKLTGVGTDAFFTPNSLSPNEAHNHLKRFLQSNFRFKTSMDIYAFVSILTNATSTNTSWNQEDGQLLLSSITTGNGLIRIRDIIRWTPVSTRAGSDRMIMSIQRGLLPLLRYISSDFVVKSTLSSMINALYTCILENFDRFSQVIEDAMDAMIGALSFKDPRSTDSKSNVSGSQVFALLAGVFYEFLTRFKNMTSLHPRIIPLMQRLLGWFESWIRGISTSPPSFDDKLADSPDTYREHIITVLRGKIGRLVAIAERGKNLERSSRRDGLSTAPSFDLNDGIIAALRSTYEGPGTDRTGGPRHDNDFVDISLIRIAPTHQELISRIRPFLPANIYAAPHPHPSDSTERLLDIQFRLLREEGTAPLRESVQLVRDDILSRKKTTKLADLISNRGGKYRGHSDGHEGIMFNVYTNVAFISLVPDRRGITASLAIDPPPGRARSTRSKDRVAYWEGMGGKRLMQGGLVALVWKRGLDVDVHLGVVASSTRELADSSQRNEERVNIRMMFFDSAVNMHILDAIHRPQNDKYNTKVLVETSVMFEAIRPFLEALCVEPEILPFKQYLVHHPPGTLASCGVAPPAYALVPGFTYQLSSLFPPESHIRDLRLRVSNQDSVRFARREVKRCSRLDKSQADALVDALTREFSLIQGPPGTGKSYTGVEIIRVLLANKVRPIVMIAFTNHALDHMLCSVLDTNITQNIVRLGSRSADERISKYSIETLEVKPSRLKEAFRRNFKNMRNIEGQIKDLMKKFLRISMEPQQIMQYIEVHYPEHHVHIAHPPLWILAMNPSEGNEDEDANSDDGDGLWEQVGKGGRTTRVDRSMYTFWKNSLDLAFLKEIESNALRTIEPPNSSTENPFSSLAFNEYDQSSDDDESIGDAVGDLKAIEEPVDPRLGSLSNQKLEPHFYPDSFPSQPDSSRPLEELLIGGEMWTLSPLERQKLHTSWSDLTREEVHAGQLEEFERLRTMHAEALLKYNEGTDEARRELMKDADIIGCTTTGAAKLTSLLKGLAPRVMLVEEAGQVLEAHVLGSLVPSVEHLILVGDPLQLRPTINNYALSVDNHRGGGLYKFDVSMMERLSKGGLPMSQIDVQRRMRPTISNLIRNTLYPRLQDHDCVQKYPPVRGFLKNVFFLTHSHKENGGVEESASKYNDFEVAMIKDLVLYLLGQGTYSKEGDIVVLCAYLGQLARVRDALSSEVAVVIDERDSLALAEREDDEADGMEIERVNVTKRVRLRTIDNYQGEEATIVILSLVRNSGSDEIDSGRPNIGFLRSDNRTNVALSRAREGLFILGNAINLSARSNMWRTVIDELEKEEAIGEAFPLVCYQHPDTINMVGKPGMIPKVSPNGGCLLACDTLLGCGHVCPLKCHPNDPNHITIECLQPCRKLCTRGHPCDKGCSEPCGNCRFPILDVLLPCGHIASSVPCHIMESLESLFCNTIVSKALPYCQHIADLKCSQDPSQYLCRQPCMGLMVCCDKICGSQCHQCQPVNLEPSPVQRSRHKSHPCHKTLYCGHPCQNPCSEDHQCTAVCKAPCRQHWQCPHTACKGSCSKPCAPCQEPCTWICTHYICPVPCGSVCTRLPCDKRCEKFLKCNHQCPSVCGEDCSIQVCPICASTEKRSTVVDLVTQKTLDQITLDRDTLDELLITIPHCRHVFTVETLDNHFNMMEYYSREDISGAWLEMKTPLLRFNKPPRCPICPNTMTSPRYSRIFKHTNLEILERSMASQMSNSLRLAHTIFESISSSELEVSLTTSAEGIKEIKGTPPDSMAQKRREGNRTQMLKTNRDQRTLTSLVALDVGSTEFHGAFKPMANAWKISITMLIQAYKQIESVVTIYSTHAPAWESAFFYQSDREAGAPTDGEEAPHPAKTRTCKPQLRIGTRYLVEAFWFSIIIRFNLVRLARSWLQTFCNRGPIFPKHERIIWTNYIEFILDSCIQDARTALDVARRSESYRQGLKASVFLMRAQLERTRFRCDKARYLGVFKDTKRLMNLVAKRRGKEEDFFLLTLKTNESLQKSKLKTAQRWRDLGEEFEHAAYLFLGEYSTLEECLQNNISYMPLSLEEWTQVAKHLDFAYAENFYRCLDGHSFVTEEDGIIDVEGSTGRCPECGEFTNEWN